MGQTRKTYHAGHSSRGRLWGFNRITGAQDGTNETLYMTRAWLGRLRVHIFHRGDQDPDCHDHPWGFWTFPLRSYVEEVLTPVYYTRPGSIDKPDGYRRSREVVKAFRLHYRPATHKHRVLGPWGGAELDKHYRMIRSTRDFYATPSVVPGVIPTIVWREKVSRMWGFTKERDGRWCWTDWIKYVYEGGKAAPCADPAPEDGARLQ